jgi:hypothetical protein
MELENIISSEISQAQKAKNHMFSFICSMDLKKFWIIIGHGSHVKGRTKMGEMGKGKET